MHQNIKCDKCTSNAIAQLRYQSVSGWKHSAFVCTYHAQMRERTESILLFDTNCIEKYIDIHIGYQYENKPRLIEQNPQGNINAYESLEIYPGKYKLFARFIRGTYHPIPIILYSNLFSRRQAGYILYMNDVESNPKRTIKRLLTKDTIHIETTHLFVCKNKIESQQFVFLEGFYWLVGNFSDILRRIQKKNLTWEGIRMIKDAQNR